MWGLMEPWMAVATALSAVNVVLLGILSTVWVRNYRTFGSEMTAGLAAFAAVLLVENAVAIYFLFQQRHAVRWRAKRPAGCRRPPGTPDGRTRLPDLRDRKVVGN
jgi:hypothetical protein